MWGGGGGGAGARPPAPPPPPPPPLAPRPPPPIPPPPPRARARARLKLPVLVVEQVRVAALEDRLLAVVLRDGGVALVDGDERVRPEAHDVVVERVRHEEVHRLGRPHVDARRQQHGLAVVLRVADVALLDDGDRAVAVLDVPAQLYRLARDPEEDRRDVVHARLREEVLVRFVHQQADCAREESARTGARARDSHGVCVCAASTASRKARRALAARTEPGGHEQLGVGAIVEASAAKRRGIVAVHATDLQIVVLRRIGAQVAAREDVLDVSAAVRVVDQTARHERRIRRRVFHVRGFVVLSLSAPHHTHRFRLLRHG